MGWGCPHLCVTYMSEVSVSVVGAENHSPASVSISPVRPQGFPGGAVVNNLPAIAGDKGDRGLIPGLGRSSGGGSGNPLQYSCLENPMDRGAWWVTVHRAAKSPTQLSTLPVLPQQSTSST